MLTLSVDPGDRVLITTRSGEEIWIKNLFRKTIRLGFEADLDIKIMREELLSPSESRRSAAGS